MPHSAYRLQVKLLGKIWARPGLFPAGRRAPRRPLLAAVLALAWGGGCSATAPTPAAQPVATATPSANVDVDEAWNDAKMVARREPGSMPVVGSGTSMQPVYGDNTMLVIKPIAYDQLRAGMTVAYLNQRGARVVHRLVEKTPEGWRVKGLNNEQVDAELVTRRNLLGVVYASFNYETDEAPAGK